MRTAIFALTSIASCSLVWAYNVQLKPAVYVPDEIEDKPTVSLCVEKGVVIRTSEFLDICLTITPPQADDKPKSFTCSSLLYRASGGANKYMIEEGGDSCMIKMRGYANSKGVSLSAPIEFSYNLEKDPSGVHDTLGTVAVHLKWTQQDRPVNQLVNRNNVGGSLSVEPQTNVILSVLIVMATLVL
jgi:hypothetical protein